MKIITAITVLLIIGYIGTQGEVFSVAKCENLAYNTSRNTESLVIGACSEVWGEMRDRDYKPNY